MFVALVPPDYPIAGEAHLEDLAETVRSLVELVNQQQILLMTALNGQVTFGDGTDPDNIQGKWMDYTTNATPNTDDTLTHNLGVVPVGFIVIVPPLSGVINRGSASWTTTQVFLRCSAASQTAKLFLLTPPQQNL